MKSKYLFFLSVLLLVGCDKTTPINYNFDGYTPKEIAAKKITVTFFNNFGKEEIELNSGLTATGSTTAFRVVQIDENSSVQKPNDPTRLNYKFNEWHTDPSNNSLFDFSKSIKSNLALYAHWTKTQEEEFVEPGYIEPSKIDNSIETLVKITGVLNIYVNEGAVNLTTAGISRLKNSKNDVSASLNYKIKENVIFNATYNETTGYISYVANLGSENESGSIKVNDVTATLSVSSSSSTYEDKAKKYESKSSNIDDHRIMLAGSSSMENWSTSTEDLLPLKTYNHGIGGTSAEEWRDKLNQRLVYPFSPKTVVYYVGVNNIINRSDSKETTASYITSMFDDVHKHLPNTKIYFVLINSLPGYQNKQNDFDYINNAAIEYENSHDYLTTLDAGQNLLKESGKPNSAYFLSDGLHMSKYGYVIWGGFIKNKLISDMKNND